MTMTNYHILFIDDDEFIRKIYEDRLVASGFILDTASSTKEGMDKIQKQPYDLICTDNILTDGSGMDIVHFIKEKKLRTPIVMFSASGQEKFMREAIDAGVTEYVVKDHIVPTELVKKFTTIIESQV